MPEPAPIAREGAGLATLTGPAAIAVIGAGPAGVAAAVYLKRANQDPLVYERAAIGGLLLNAYRVENYPGFPAGISGSAMGARLAAHLERWRVKVRLEEVETISARDGAFVIKTATGVHAADFVVLACGTKALHAGFPGEAENAVHEVRLLGRVRRGDRAVVIGGGDAAFDYALTLARRGCRSRVFFRSEPRCLPLLYNRARASRIISLHPEAEPVRCERVAAGIAVSFSIRGTIKKALAEHLLVAVGRVANLDLVGPGLRSDFEKGALPPGLFLAGDVMNGRHRQAGIAVGQGLDGAMAIMDRLHAAAKERRIAHPG